MKKVSTVRLAMVILYSISHLSCCLQLLSTAPSPNASARKLAVLPKIVLVSQSQRDEIGRAILDICGLVKNLSGAHFTCEIVTNSVGNGQAR